MDFLAQPFELYQGATKGLESAWVVVKPDPGGKNNYLLAQDGDPNELWHMVDQTIRNAANRYNKFSICVAPNKNAMQTVIPVTVVANPYNGPQQMAGIGSMPGMYGGYPADIGAIEKRLEEKYEQKLKDALEKKDLEDRLAGLEDALRAKRRKSGDWVEKLDAVAQTTNLDLSNPQSIAALSGLVMGALDKVLGAFTRHPQPTPAMAGTPQRGRTQVHRFETDETVPPPADDMDETDEPELTELSDQEEMALQALEILEQAGAENPGELLIRVARYYEKNPEQAKGFLNFL